MRGDIDPFIVLGSVRLHLGSVCSVRVDARRGRPVAELRMSRTNRTARVGDPP